MGPESRFGLLSGEKPNIVVVNFDSRALSRPTGSMTDMPKLIGQVVAGGADAVMGYHGTLTHHSNAFRERAVARILTVTHNGPVDSQTTKTSIYPDPSDAIEDAVAFGMNGIAVHLSTESVHTREMLQTLTGVRMARDRSQVRSIPLLVAVSPRGEDSTGADKVHDVGYGSSTEQVLFPRAVAIAAENGADVITTEWVNPDIVSCADNVPVVFARDPQSIGYSTEGLLGQVHKAIQNGARGVSLGQAVARHEDPQGFVVALGEIVHNGKSVQEAISQGGIHP